MSGPVSLVLFVKSAIRVIFITGMLQFSKITADLQQKFILLVDDLEIGLGSMAQNICFFPIYVRSLTAKQLRIFGIRLLINVKMDKSALRNWDHVVEPQQTQPAFIDLHDVTPRLNVCVVWFWRLHGDKILIGPHQQNHADVGAASALVILDPGVFALEIVDILV